MFTRTTRELSGLEKAITELHEEMRSFNGDSPEYAKMVAQLANLYKMREHDAPYRVSADTLAIVIGNLVGIALIVSYEQRHVVTSKALSFVLKLR